MELTAYRNQPKEQARIRDLEALIPDGHSSLLDVGTRDGYIARRLAARFDAVTVLDLTKPEIDGDNIVCVEGDVTRLPFGDDEFDVVLCAEVLEHIPTHLLPVACRELVRVAKHLVVIGVPYRQDLRVGRLTCSRCGAGNPPWNHVNSFDEARLDGLFHQGVLSARTYVGQGGERTNAVSAWLMDLAGNPWGTYGQEEPCLECGARMDRAPEPSLAQRALAKLAFLLRPGRRSGSVPFWIHSVYAKAGEGAVSEGARAPA